MKKVLFSAFIVAVAFTMATAFAGPEDGDYKIEIIRGAPSRVGIQMLHRYGDRSDDGPHSVFIGSRGGVKIFKLEGETTRSDGPTMIDL